MIIQTGYNVSVYGVTTGSGIRQQSSGSSKSAIADATKATDTVTLSNASKALAASDPSGSAKNSVSATHPWISEAAHSDTPENADKLAYGLAYGSDGILYDADSMLNKNELRLASTKELVTDQDRSYFSQMSAQATQQRISLYESEKAKGTPPAQIVDMLLAQTNTMPEKYKHLAGWG